MATSSGALSSSWMCILEAPLWLDELSLDVTGATEWWEFYHMNGNAAAERQRLCSHSRQRGAGGCHWTARTSVRPRREGGGVFFFFCCSASVREPSGDRLVTQRPWVSTREYGGWDRAGERGRDGDMPAMVKRETKRNASCSEQVSGDFDLLFPRRPHRLQLIVGSKPSVLSPPRWSKFVTFSLLMHREEWGSADEKRSAPHHRPIFSSASPGARLGRSRRSDARTAVSVWPAWGDFYNETRVGGTESLCSAVAEQQGERGRSARFLTARPTWHTSGDSFWVHFNDARTLGTLTTRIQIHDARVQSGGPGQRRGREVRPHRAVRHRDVHREVRPDHRGFLPQGDRGGLLAVGAGDPGHRGHRAVRLHAGPLHQKRPGVHPGLQPCQPAELPGHKADEGSDHKSEKVGFKNQQENLLWPSSVVCWMLGLVLRGPVVERWASALLWGLCSAGDAVCLQGNTTRLFYFGVPGLSLSGCW